MIRKLTFAGIVAALVVGWAVPAWAHVTVAPPTAEKGATDLQVAFQVPNEETTATTKIDIVFPTDPPLLGVSAASVPGWTAKVTTKKLDTPITTDDGQIDQVVSDVTWTADSAAAGIQPESFQAFTVLVGQLPDAGDQVVFKAVQTYANGDVVNWVDPVTPSGPAAEHPTPILTLTSGASGETTTTLATGGSATGAVKTAKDNADAAKTIGIIAIIFSVLALIGVAIGFAMRRKPAAS
jgi:uncharacterized protein YcnI